MIVSGNNERFSENFFKLEIGLVCGFSLYGGKARLQGDFFSDGRISLIYSFLTEGDVTGDVLRCRQHLIAIHSLLTKGDSNLYQFSIPFSLILSFILTVSLLYPPQIHLFAPIFFANCTIHLRCESPGVSVCT